MSHISKYFLLIFCFCAFSLNAQIESLIPIHSEPEYLINEEGKIMAELPNGEIIVSSPDGKAGAWWSDGIDIGKCGNIVTYNYKTQLHSLFSSEGIRKKKLSDKFANVSPCSEGFHLAKVQEESQYGYFNFHYVFLDETGQVIFNPKGFRKADHFNDGLAAVLTQDNEWVYINDLGHELDIIPKSIKKIRNVTSFYNNVSIITTTVPANKKRGTFQVYMINKEGDILFNSQEEYSETQSTTLEAQKVGLHLRLIY